MQPLGIGVRDDHPICGEVRDVAVDLRQQVAVVPEHDPLPQMRAELVDHGRTTSTLQSSNFGTTVPSAPVLVAVRSLLR